MGSTFSEIAALNSEALFDKDNQEQVYAYEMISKTQNSFFLTGRAGTGKTSFLKYVQKNIRKNFVILAPTGVAAINAGGTTIHSFFGLNYGVIGPKDIAEVNSRKISVIKNVDTIIIDEVSMVRCDIMDAIDRALRHIRKSPEAFGGVQMVFVGDLFQLPPIATASDSDLLSKIYGTHSFYFYRSKAIQRIALPKIEFLRIYRQKDEQFIKILDSFRLGNVTPSILRQVNERVTGSILDKDDYRITLTSYKNDAELINRTRLSEIDSQSYFYEASYERDWTRCKDVAEDVLELKVGAHVMFTRNDSNGRWVNGTIGRISELTENSIQVCLGNGESEFVGKERWDAIEYVYNEETKEIKQSVVGSVTQYPLRLAWAMTIHKSQSLSFDKVAIDFGFGAFTYGQAYVALSRCRSLAGLQLLKPITFRSVQVSQEIIAFASSFNDNQQIAQELTIGETIDEDLRAHNFDGAATKLYDMAITAAKGANIPYAYDLMNRALGYVIEDDCLKGKRWEPVWNNSTEAIILNAIGLFYSGDHKKSLAILEAVLNSQPDNFNAMYVRTRCLEMDNRWDEVKDSCFKMMDIFQKAKFNGVDSVSFRKLGYRIAVYDDSIFANDGLNDMKRMVLEHPLIDTYHLALKQMIQKHKDEEAFRYDNANHICQQLFDRKINPETFLQTIKKERSENSEMWQAYISYLRNLEIPEGLTLWEEKCVVDAPIYE